MAEETKTVGERGQVALPKELRGRFDIPDDDFVAALDVETLAESFGSVT